VFINLLPIKTEAARDRSIFWIIFQSLLI
jgi:hypothetical protein